MKRLLLLLILLVTAFQGFSQTRYQLSGGDISPQAQEIPGSDAQGNILANSAVSTYYCKCSWK
jgi:hypothetical protein